MLTDGLTDWMAGWTGLDSTRLDWIRLDWTGLDCLRTDGQTDRSDVRTDGRTEIGFQS